jgi:ABC-type maltose transport system permease subunit
MKDALKDFLKRYGVLSAILLLAAMTTRLEMPEIRTLLLASILECLAVAFSSLASYVFTRIKFTEQPQTPNLGLIFLGVHICFGFSVLALYLAQFVN